MAADVREFDVRDRKAVGTGGCAVGGMEVWMMGVLVSLH